MSSTDQTDSSDLAGWLAELQQTCQRIQSSQWIRERRGHTEALLQKHVLHNLIPSTLRYIEQTKLLIPSLEGESLDTGSTQYITYRQRLKDATEELSNALDVLSFAGVKDDVADFDELNALYCELFMRKDGVLSEYDITKISHSFESFRTVISESFGPKAKVDNSRWGLPGCEMPPPKDMSQSIAESLFSSMENRWKPRHIRKDAKTSPYKWDPKVDPEPGSNCVVRKATSHATGKDVAVKTMSQVSSRKDRRQVLQELGVLEVCHHPNLVQIVDAYETPDGKIHLVFSPWAPFTLSHFLGSSDQALRDKSPWFKPGDVGSNRIILRLSQHMAAGLGELHRMSIKHKDIKPANILLHHEQSGDDVKAIITDCGVSKIYRKGDLTNYTNSTWIYLAPEQLDLSQSTLKADIWQLGCCFSLALARACGGLSAYEFLSEAYTKTEDARSCNIGMELVHFLPALHETCASEPGALRIIHGMLETCPSQRWDIGMVQTELAKLA